MNFPVTHSRRIFVQQLGRGLRIAPGKEKVIVLDFVSDIRRFAAGLDLKVIRTLLVGALTAAAAASRIADAETWARNAVALVDGLVPR